MAGRLGVIGSSYTTSGRSGRIGTLQSAPKPIEQPQTVTQNSTTPSPQKSNFFSDAAKNVGNVAGNVGNAVNGFFGAKSTRGGKDITATDVVKSQIVDPAVNVVKQATTGQKAGVNTLQGGAGLADPSLVKNQTDYIQSQVGKRITQKQADSQIADLQSKATKSATKIATAQKDTGTTLNQSQGVNDLLNTAGLVTGVAGGIGKVVAKGALRKAEAGAAKDAVTTAQASPIKSTGRIAVSPEAVLAKENTPLELRKSAPPTETKPFAPLDKSTQSKIDTLATESHAKQPEPGTTRLYQMNDKGAEGVKSDQYFKDPNKLANFANGRSDNAEFSFKDVPDHQALQVPGKPDVYKVNENAPVPTEKPITDTTPTEPKVQGDTVSGNSARIQQKALEDKLNVTMGDLPKYKSLNMKEQAQSASDLIANDRQKAIDIIDGKANPPDGLHPQAVHQALELDAIKNKDGALLVKLANSHINTELSEGAQKLRIAAERDPLSATEQIRQIQDARAKRATIRGTSVKKEIQKAIKVVSKSTKVSTSQDLKAFIKELTC